MQNRKTAFFLILSFITGITYALWQSEPGLIEEKYLFYVSRAFYICMSIVFIDYASRFLVERVIGRAGDKIPSELLRVLINIALYMIFAALILKFGFNMKLAALITTSALLTAVLGFAMQATLGNVFSGLSLQVEQIFYIGDTVSINDTIGQIEALTWRSVSLRTPQGSLIVIPNSKISSANVEVFPKDRPILINIKIPVPIMVPPQQVKTLLKSIISYVPHIIKEKPIIINMESMKPANRSSEYGIICFCDNFLLRFAVMGIIKERIWYAFLRNGIDLTDICEVDKNFKVPEIAPPSSDFYLAIISKTRLFKDLFDEEKAYIIDNSKNFLYASGEPIFFRNALFIIASGKIKAKYPRELTDKIIALSSSLITEEKTEKIEQELWDAEILNKVSEQLIKLIGPIGEYLVKQTSAKTLDTYYLYAMLAEEIIDHKKRALFLKNMPKGPVRYFSVGDTIGEAFFFTKIVNSKIHYEAMGQTEIIAVKKDTIKEIIERRPKIIADLTEKLFEIFNRNPECFAFFEDDNHRQKIEDALRKNFFKKSFNKIVA